MKLNHKFVAFLLALVALSAKANDDGLMVSLKVERDGQTVSTPSIWSQYGQDSAIQIGESLRIELNANDLGTSADLKMKLYASESGNLKLASSPRIFVNFATESAIQFTTKDGAIYKITVTPIRATRPI